MKRSKHLETLSWEHHDGLVVALRIQKGIEKSADTNIIADYLLHIWENALSHHFKQEEAGLPDALIISQKGESLLNRMISEHREFESRIDTIKKRDKNISASLHAFSTKLNTHIRFEERELFPFIEKNAKKEMLEKISNYLHGEHKTKEKDCPVHFWK